MPSAVVAWRSVGQVWVRQVNSMTSAAMPPKLMKRPAVRSTELKPGVMRGTTNTSPHKAPAARPAAIPVNMPC